MIKVSPHNSVAAALSCTDAAGNSAKGSRYGPCSTNQAAIFSTLIAVPGFRARYIQKIAPWALTEYDEEGEAVIHGYREGTDCEVLFELQNLTEVGPTGFGAQELHIGLCGLAYRARVRRGKGKTAGRRLKKPHRRGSA